MSSPGAPLAGARVVALEQFGAGPFATLDLADMSADVIKVEEELGFDTSQREQLATSGAFGSAGIPRDAVAAPSARRR